MPSCVIQGVDGGSGEVSQRRTAIAMATDPLSKTSLTDLYQRQ